MDHVGQLMTQIIGKVRCKLLRHLVEVFPSRRLYARKSRIATKVYVYQTSGDAPDNEVKQRGLIKKTEEGQDIDTQRNEEKQESDLDTLYTRSYHIDNGKSVYTYKFDS